RGVVEVLQAARGVSTRGLNVPAGIRTDPHVLPRGRDDEILDPLGILDLIAARVDVAEAVLTRQPVEPRFRRVAAAYLHIHPPCRGRSQFTGNWAGRSRGCASGAQEAWHTWGRDHPGCHSDRER